MHLGKKRRWWQGSRRLSPRHMKWNILQRRPRWKKKMATSTGNLKLALQKNMMSSAKPQPSTFLWNKWETFWRPMALILLALILKLQEDGWFWFKIRPFLESRFSLLMTQLQLPPFWTAKTCCFMVHWTNARFAMGVWSLMADVMFAEGSTVSGLVALSAPETLQGNRNPLSYLILFRTLWLQTWQFSLLFILFFLRCVFHCCCLYPKILSFSSFCWLVFLCLP